MMLKICEGLARPIDNSGALIGWNPAPYILGFTYKILQLYPIELASPCYFHYEEPLVPIIRGALEGALVTLLSKWRLSF